jgi:CheY-like chemotaxis protein
MTQAQILVVEDEAILAAAIKRQLQKMGYNVAATAASGEDAITQAGKFRPDLVIMDIKLTGEMDGIEAANEIFTRFQIPVIYLSAYADEQTLRRAQANHFFGYLKKPFTYAELQDMIEMALLKNGTQQEEKDD